MAGSLPGAEIGKRRADWSTVGVWLGRIWIFTRKRPLGAFGGLVLVLLVITAVFAPVIATHDPLQQYLEFDRHAPGRQFLFGTDTLGRDQFSRVVYGARVSLYVGLVSVAIAAVVGTVLGVSSAYFGGKLDLFLQRLVDGMQGIPSLVLVLALVVALGASLNNVTIAIAVGFTSRLVRVARSPALSVKEETYVQAAQASGASHGRIIFRHVVPNSLTPIIIVTAALLGRAIVTEASLSFLGLGVPPPDPSWGRMLEDGARGYMEAAPWLVIFPGVALTITVLSFNMFADALRDDLDPRLRRGA